MIEQDWKFDTETPICLFIQKMGIILFDELFPPSNEGYGMDLMKKLSQNPWMKVPSYTKEDLAFYMVQQNTVSYAINFDKIKACCEYVLNKTFEIKDEHASSLLIYDFQSVVKKMIDKINFPEQINLKEIPSEKDMFFLDSRFFDFMLGEFSKENKFDEYSKKIHKKIDESKQRFKSYNTKDEKSILDLVETIWSPTQKLEDIPVFALELSRRLWEFRVEKRWKRKILNKPAFVMPVGQCVIEACWNPNNKIKEINDKKLIATPSGRTVALITEETLLTIDEIQKRHSLLRTLIGHKMIRYFTHEYHSRFFHTNTREPGRLEFEGGREKLAEILKIKSKKLFCEIPEILRAGQNFSMKLSDGTYIGGLWNFMETKSSGRNKSHIWVTLGEALRPHFMYNLKKNQQILLPVVPIPTLVNPNNYHGQQASAQFLIVQRLVSDRKFLRTHGGGLFTKEVLEEIAHQVGLPLSVMSKAWSAWQQDSDTCEAFIEKIDKDIYQIAGNNTFIESRKCIEHLINQSNEGFEKASKRINKKLQTT